MDFQQIPIFIISYNRLSDIQICIEKFSKDGYKNLIIIDNASTDKKLIEFLKSLPYKVYFLEKNWGPYVVWESHLFDNIISTNFYVVTDPDIIPIEECPSNYVNIFFKILQQYPNKTKVGFSLKLDDIPDEYKYKYDIWRFESFYWENPLQFDKFFIYDAPIDTTFALYRPGLNTSKKSFFSSYRVGFPYSARHLGWYVKESETKLCNDGYYESNSKGSTSNSQRNMVKARYDFVYNFIRFFNLNFIIVIYHYFSSTAKKILKNLLKF